MKKFAKVILVLTIVATLFVSVGLLSACNKNSEKTITVCASDVPHAEILEGVVKDLLKDKGYDLKVTILNWTHQNGAVVSGDYDANYFQYYIYLLDDKSANGLDFSCKVHYEPLGIYYGKASVGTAVSNGQSFAICKDTTNAVRALQLLEEKGVFSKASEGNNYPITDDETLSSAVSQNQWVSTSGIIVKLIEEELLVGAMPDYDFACLPCNTALTGHVIADSNHRADIENASKITDYSNGLAIRKADYLNNEIYKAKIDALTDALLSKEVADYVKTKYNGVILCDAQTQIDMRGDIK